MGDLDSCESHLNQLETLITAEGKSHQGYARRRAIVTRARLLLKRGEPTEAVALLDEAALEHAASSDAVFATTAQITAAQALSRIGQRRESAQALLRAELAGATQVRDVQAQSYYAAGDAVGITDPALGYQLRDRARRLWEYQGIVALEREMESVPAPRDQGRKSHRHPTAAVNALGSIIDLAHSPGVLGEELVRTLTGFGIDATVTSDVPSAPTWQAPRRCRWAQIAAIRCGSCAAGRGAGQGGADAGRPQGRPGSGGPGTLQGRRTAAIGRVAGGSHRGSAGSAVHLARDADRSGGRPPRGDDERDLS